MDREVVTSALIETETEDDIIGEDKNVTGLSEDNTLVLLSAAGLELIFMDGELVISALLET